MLGRHCPTGLAPIWIQQRERATTKSWFWLALGGNVLGNKGHGFFKGGNKHNIKFSTTCTVTIGELDSATDSRIVALKAWIHVLKPPRHVFSSGHVSQNVTVDFKASMLTGATQTLFLPLHNTIPENQPCSDQKLHFKDLYLHA